MAAGKILVIGIGSGEEHSITPEARQALAECDVIVGYETYLTMIHHLIDRQQVISSGMGREIERGLQALELAEAGSTVGVVSSGDPGVYGMAGVILELASKRNSLVEVLILPGITAASLAAAALGAPLMHDFAVISLSDLLTPWEKIAQRLELCSQADMVICLYNPRSRGRTEQLEWAWEIMSRYKRPETPVGMVRNAGRPQQEVFITELRSMLNLDPDMFSLIVVGNQSTYVNGRKMITPRGYVL